MMDENGIAILPGANLVTRNSDVDYMFRQDSDFHYLTGFDEQDAVFVLIPGRAHGEAILFCRERDPEQERWHGKITGPERAMQLYGMDDAFPISDIDDILPAATIVHNLVNECAQILQRAGKRVATVSTRSPPVVFQPQTKSYRLWHSPGARSSRVLWTVHELGIENEIDLVTMPFPPRMTHKPYLKHNVLGTIIFQNNAFCIGLDLNNRILG